MTPEKVAAGRSAKDVFEFAEGASLMYDEYIMLMNWRISDTKKHIINLQYSIQCCMDADTRAWNKRKLERANESLRKHYKEKEMWIYRSEMHEENKQKAN